MTDSIKKINMLDAVKLFFKNYFNFGGRASRSEFWWFMLAYFIVVVLSLCIDATMVWYNSVLTDFDGIDYNNPYDVYYSQMIGAASLIGITSLTSRRLQDMGRTGWWQLGLYIGQIPLFLFGALVFTSFFNPGVIGTAVIFLLAYSGYSILILVWLCLPPKQDQNKWGKNPLLPDTRITDQIPGQSL